MGNTTKKVFSVADLIAACAHDAINNSRTIDFLAIFGHGTDGYQSVGAGQSFEETGTKSLLYRGIVARGGSHLNGPAEEKLTALNGLLSPKATIFLAGCNVGGGGQGTGLLTTVSTALQNRVVQGFENKVFYWTGTLTGSLKEARGSDVNSSFTIITV